jgi:hypothetical protein
MPQMPQAAMTELDFDLDRWQTDGIALPTGRYDLDCDKIIIFAVEIMRCCPDEDDFIAQLSTIIEHEYIHAEMWWASKWLPMSQESAIALEKAVYALQRIAITEELCEAHRQSWQRRSAQTFRK